MSNIITFPLTRGHFATINSEDYDLVSKYNWYRAKSKHCFYAVATTGRRIFMHRLIMGLLETPKIHIDHKDHNGLNNCRDNLRICTVSQNNYNQRKRLGATSKYKGVSWNSKRKKWCAEIWTDGVKTRLGRFIDEDEAGLAYNKAAIEQHGEFATLNIIPLS